MNRKNEIGMAISGSGGMAEKAEGIVNEGLGNKGRQRPNSNPKSMQGFIDIHLDISKLALIAAFGITAFVGVSAYLEEQKANLAEQNANLAEQIDLGEMKNHGYIKGDYARLGGIKVSSFGYTEDENSYGCLEISSYDGTTLRCEKMAPEDVIDFSGLDLGEIASAEYLENGIYIFRVDGILNCIAVSKGTDSNNSFSMSCPSSNGEGFDKGYYFNPNKSEISVVVDGVEKKSKKLTSVSESLDIDYLGNGRKQEIEAMLKRLQNTDENPELKNGAKNGI